jgi:hypothetical protein
VVPGETLLPNIYEFESTSPILLSKISERHNHSETSVNSTSNATAFAQHVKQREGNLCAVTRLPDNLKASHLIPKRLGPAGVTDVMTRFSGAQVTPGIMDIFDPRLGLYLTGNLDILVDNFRLGFFHYMVSYIEFYILLF